MIGSVCMLGLNSESVSPAEHDLLTQNRVAGVILFKRNFKSFEQIYHLCRDLKSIGQNSDQGPPLIAVDMEGGLVNRFSHLTDSLPWPSAERLSQKNPEEIFSVAKILGKHLHLLGFDINFAPVVDLPLVQSSLLKTRTFGSSPPEVIEKAAAFIKGLQAEGIVPCLKHFPGHGGVTNDSHYELPKDLRTLKELESQLKIFETLSAYLPICVMTGHIEFSHIEKTPATFSKILLKKELQSKRCFSGLIISDDICMLALKNFSYEHRVKKALLAGCDLVLHGSGDLSSLEIFEYFKNNSCSDLKNAIQNSSKKILDFKKQRKHADSVNKWKDIKEQLHTVEAEDLFKRLGFL